MPKAKITLTTVSAKIGTLDHKIGTLDHRVGTLDHKIDKLSDLVQKMFAQTQVAVQSLQSRVDEQAEQLRNLQVRVDALHGLMEKLLVHVERLDQECVMITAALKRLEARFDQLDADRLRERVKALEDRVTALESIQN